MNSTTTTVMETSSEDDPFSSSSSSSGGGSDGIVKTMLIFAGVMLVVFTGLYLMFHCRAKKSNADRLSSREQRRQRTDEDDSSQETQPEIPPPPPKPKFTQPLVEREPQPGDPIYDSTLIGGTASLGVMMWIGATIVLIMSLVNQSKYNGASTNDFQIMGTTSNNNNSNRHCRILSSNSYTYRDKELNALNTVCIEEWEYYVYVPPIPITNNKDFDVDVDIDEESSYFVSATFSLDSCRGTCETCMERNRLYGPNYYAGVDPKKGGTNIDNPVTVECWVPTKPVEQLSDFYNCGTQRNVNGTCYLLKDSSIILKDEEHSTQIGLISAYCCYAGGFILLLLVGYFVHRNKQVRREAIEAGLLVVGTVHDENNDSIVDVNGGDEEQETKVNNDVESQTISPVPNIEEGVQKEATTKEDLEHDKQSK